MYLERATQGLVEAGKPVDGELLQFLSPLGWEHINLTGDYVWRQSRRLEDGKTGSFGPYGCPENLSVRFFPNSAGSPSRDFGWSREHSDRSSIRSARAAQPLGPWVLSLCTDV